MPRTSSASARPRAPTSRAAARKRTVTSISIADLLDIAVRSKTLLRGRYRIIASVQRRIAARAYNASEALACGFRGS